MTDWPYIWSWSKRPMDRDRKGQRCRVLARGAMNSALVEFEDGTRHIASRNGLRKADPEVHADPDPPHLVDKESCVGDGGIPIQLSFQIRVF